MVFAVYELPIGKFSVMPLPIPLLAGSTIPEAGTVMVLPGAAPSIATL